MNSLEGKTCLVTGGAGFVGSHLVLGLAAAGARVVVLDIKETSVAPEHMHLVRTVVGSVTDRNVVDATLKGVDVVFHLAALTSVPGSVEDPEEYHNVNVGGTLTILEAVRTMEHPPRIIFASSASVYGNQDTVPVHEQLERRPMSPYALTKAMSEDLLLLWHSLYGVETVSLRCFNIYGPGMNPDGPYASLIGRFIKLRAAQSPLTVTGDGEQTRDHIEVSDVVHAYMMAALDARVGHGEILNIASGIGTTVNRVAEIIGGDRTNVPERPGDLRHSVADISKAQKLLGWSPEVSLEDGLMQLKQSAKIT